MKRDRVWVLLLLILMVVQMQGFAAGSQEQAATGTSTVVLWDRSVNEKQYVDALANKFVETRPEINLDVQYYIKERDPSQPQPLAVALAGGEDIDVYSVATPLEMRTYYDMGKALDLKPLIEEDKIDLAPFGKQYETYEIEGHYPGMFYRSIFFSVYYNTEMFDRQGVAYPKDSMLWSEYANLAKKMTHTADGKTVWGTFVGSWNLGTTWTFSVQDGHTIFSRESLPSIKKALAFEKQLWDSGAAMPFAEVAALKTYSIPQFEIGTMAMAFEGEWLPGEVNNDIRAGKSNVEFDMALPPVQPGGSPGITATFSCPLIINPDCQDLEAAWEVVKFYCMEEGAQVVASRGFLPAYQSPKNLETYLNSMSGRPSRFAELVPQLSLIPAYPPMSAISELDKIFAEERQLMAIGEKTLDQTMADFEKRAAHLIY